MKDAPLAVLLRRSYQPKLPVPMASPVRKESETGIATARVLQVSTAHWPYDHRIFRKEILSLVKSGYQVAFAATVDQPEVVSGVEFIPLGKYGGSRWQRIARNLRALLAMMTTPADVIHIDDPELLLTDQIALGRCNILSSKPVCAPTRFWQRVHTASCYTMPTSLN